MKICVCLSIGQNPVSGRERMALGDRVALELALSSGAAVSGLYVGPKSPVLNDYLGMGLQHILHIDSTEADIVPLMVSAIKNEGFDLILTGAVAETGLSSGMVPYLLAEELALPILAKVISFERTDGNGLTVVQAEASGKRRVRKGEGTAVLIVDAKAVQPRISTLAGERSGEITSKLASLNLPQEKTFETLPAKKRSARLKAGSGQAKQIASLHTDLSAAAAAQTILEFLQREGHVSELQSMTSDRSDNV